jgi:hypothetical protein
MKTDYGVQIFFLQNATNGNDIRIEGQKESVDACAEEIVEILSAALADDREVSSDEDPNASPFAGDADPIDVRRRLFSVQMGNHEDDSMLDLSKVSVSVPDCQVGANYVL